MDGPALPLKRAVRAEVYSVGREALVKAFRHAGASNIEAELEYAANQLRVFVRDDGCGIDPQILHSGRDGHWGLSGMRASGKNWSETQSFEQAAGGTEVELRVPSSVAFESHSSNRATKWLSRLHAPDAQRAKRERKERVHK